MTDNSIVMVSTADYDSVSASHAPVIDLLTAGAALFKLAFCYIDSNGVVQKSVATVKEDTELDIEVSDGGTPEIVSSGTVTISHSRCDGVTLEAVASGGPVALYGKGTILSYTDGSTANALTPGAPLYVGAVAGHLEAAPVAAYDRPVARAISTTDIVVL